MNTNKPNLAELPHAKSAKVAKEPQPAMRILFRAFAQFF